MTVTDLPRSPPWRRDGGAWLAYGLALAIGLCAAGQAFPLAALLGRLPPGAPPFEDYLQHVTGQVYFLAQPWHWPLFEVMRLNPPHGVNIALTDSIPLVAVLLKLLHPLLPWVQQGVGPWLGLAWVLQPVAAVFALRSTGERRVLPALAVAVIATSMPTFLFRYLHAALDGHFVLLFALGLSLRAVRAQPRRAWLRWSVAAGALLVLSLFIHPYLMAMVAATVASVPLTFAIRALFGARAERRECLLRAGGSAAIVAAASALTVLAARLFGYLQPGLADGYGVYSMNLAAPFWPALSGIVPRLGFGPIEATGGQYEGYQYLGAGLIGLLAATVLSARPRRWLIGCVRRHAGLVLAMVGLTFYATSTHVWLLHHRLLDLDMLPPGGSAFRASGRLFWPVAYVLMLVGVRGVALLPGAVAPVLLCGAMALQFYDALPLRRSVQAGEQAIAAAPSPQESRLRETVDRFAAIRLRPRLECGVEDKTSPMQLPFLAARRDIAVDSMYVARIEPANRCGADAGEDNVLPPGTLGVAHGTDRLAIAGLWQAGGAACSVLGPYALCARDGAALAGLPPPPSSPPLPQGQAVGVGQRDLLARTLAAGWYPMENWGVWAASAAPSLLLVLPPALAQAPVRVTLRMHGPPQLARRQVVLHAGTMTGPVVARWDVLPPELDYSAVLPAGLGRVRDGLVLTLEDGPTVNVEGDARNFGIGLVSVRIDPLD